VIVSDTSSVNYFFINPFVLQSNVTAPVPSLVIEIAADPLAVMANYSPLVKSKHDDYP